MARLSPTTDTIRALFARSGNQCTFPGCIHQLINAKNQFIGQVCHIEAALPRGERYNPEQSDEDRRAYENLILFCYPHHIETNDVTDYSVDTLRGIKRDHESHFEISDFKIDETALHKIVAEMEEYWTKIERLNTLDHKFAELAFHINTQGDYFDLVKICEENITYLAGFHEQFRESDETLQRDVKSLLERKNLDPHLFDDVPYYKNPLHSRNWELHHIGVPNRMQRLRIDLMHMEIKYLEEFLKTNNKDMEAKERLQTLKKTFAELAQHALVID